MATSATTSHSKPIEEETLPDYDAEHFYPVHIGDTLNARYSVLGKLGYGANLEETVNRHLSGLSTSHPGCFNIRQSLDDFYLHRANGFRHYCIVHEPLHTTMSQFQRLHGTARPLPEVLVKYFMQYLLQGLDFLHTEASVAHCGSLFRPISSGNLRSAERHDSCWKILG
ncbi:Serine/threonine protein [Sphaerulina musiva]